VIRTERKGITGTVTIGSKAPQSWKIYSLPMSDLAAIHFQNGPCEGPCFYRTRMPADTQPDTILDTYLDTQHLRKGELWINGRALGRFWFIGPQFSLYTPGPWLHKGNNEVLFFDLQGTPDEPLTSVTEPVFAVANNARN
jgi:beta-galactosidase